MKVQVPYGSTQLGVELPESTTVLRSNHTPALEDERGTFLTSLRNPISSTPLVERVSAQDRIAIIISDITRPTPMSVLCPGCWRSWLLYRVPVRHSERYRFASRQYARRANPDVGCRSRRDRRGRQS